MKSTQIAMDYFGAAAMDSYPAFERLRCCNCSREFNYSRDNVFVCGGRSPLCAACTTNTQSVAWPEPCRHLSRGCTFWEADEAALAEHQGLTCSLDKFINLKILHRKKADTTRIQYKPVIC